MKTSTARRARPPHRPARDDGDDRGRATTMPILQQPRGDLEILAAAPYWSSRICSVCLARAISSLRPPGFPAPNHNGRRSPSSCRCAFACARGRPGRRRRRARPHRFRGGAHGRAANGLGLEEGPQVGGVDIAGDGLVLCLLAADFGDRQHQREHGDEQRDLLVAALGRLDVSGHESFLVSERSLHRACRSGIIAA